MSEIRLALLIAGDADADLAELLRQDVLAVRFRLHPAFHDFVLLVESGGYFLFFFLNDPAPTEISPLSLPAALPICSSPAVSPGTCPACAAAATSAQPSARLGSPRTENLPPAQTTSTGAASRRWAAIRMALSRTTRPARSAALPPIAAVRLPYVPPPVATSALSPVSTSMVSGSTPSTSPIR